MHATENEKQVNPLKAKVPVTGTGAPDLTAIRRAERAMKNLSRNFDDWIDEEAQNLHKARAEMRAHGLAGEVGETVFRVAHDLRGQGETFGYPVVTEICASLCRLMEAGMEAQNTPVDLVEHHINAVRAVIRDRAKGAASGLASNLVSELNLATQAFIATTAKASDQAG
ncbi:MAG: Hpt domain-containing protein [Alphaproteobacteria bacterium]